MTAAAPSLMQAEAMQAPAVAARLLAAEAPAFAALGARWRAEPPAALLTVARGSSDHAAQYFGYLAMARLGRLVTSLPPSVLTLYRARLQERGLWAIAFSQSGRSPDLVLPLQDLGARGAHTLALVNAADSPLAAAAQQHIALHAGAERSVAATKSFIAQLVAAAALVAAWQQDAAFSAALQALPQALQAAAAADWRAAIEPLRGAERLYVIGRGTGLAVAMEAALKLKEVCGIQAEAFSGAELRHGPIALVEPGFAVLVLAPPGPAQAGLLELAQALRGQGARVLLAAPAGTPGAELPLATSEHADLDPICVAQSFYPLAEALARARGLDPDQPRHLHKVTLTR
ncbi:MAG: SIS domain-containing protein [Proteobacteria bacterium]|nr:SIS domain-containing protein [Pseudomonadota bacterium]